MNVPKDRHFDGWRSPRTEGAAKFVEAVIDQVRKGERRLRTRRLADERTFQITTAGLVSNLAHLCFTEPEAALAVPRSHRRLGLRSRYIPPAENKTLPRLLDTLAAPDVGLITQVLGMRRPEDGRHIRTTVRPTGQFIDMLARFDIGPDDIGRSPDEEVIYLRATKADCFDRGELMPYADTPETVRWRGEVRSINRWLEAADLDFHGWAGTAGEVDASERRLRRYFTRGEFHCGGRLFGGFWMGLGKHERRSGLRLDGLPVVELDYGQISLRLLYGLIGEAPPEGDLYALPGIAPGQRPAVKVLLNAMLFSEKALTRKPKRPTHLDEFLRGRSIADWTSAVLQAHPALKGQFHCAVGHRLQRKESDIMVDLLLRLIEEGVTALPLHDGVIVRVDRATCAKALMEEVFRRQVGLPAEVRVGESELTHEVPLRDAIKYRSGGAGLEMSSLFSSSGRILSNPDIPL